MTNSKVYIRPVEISDAETILMWENDVENWSTSENDSPYSLFDILNLIHELQDINKGGQGRWIVCFRKNDEVLGAVDLTEINFSENEATVGVLIADKKYRNKGYANEALAFLELEALKLGINKLKCTIHESNQASIKLFQNRKFQIIGKSDDTYLNDGVYIEVLILEKWLKK
jgi:diamine N-acetyltransferase